MPIPVTAEQALIDTIQIMKDLGALKVESVKIYVGDYKSVPAQIKIGKETWHLQGTRRYIAKYILVEEQTK